MKLILQVQFYSTESDARNAMFIVSFDNHETKQLLIDGIESSWTFIPFSGSMNRFQGSSGFLASGDDSEAANFYFKYFSFREGELGAFRWLFSQASFTWLSRAMINIYVKASPPRGSLCNRLALLRANQHSNRCDENIAKPASTSSLSRIFGSHFIANTNSLLFVGVSCQVWGI